MQGRGSVPITLNVTAYAFLVNPLLASIDTLVRSHLQPNPAALEAHSDRMRARVG